MRRLETSTVSDLNTASQSSGTERTVSRNRSSLSPLFRMVR